VALLPDGMFFTRSVPIVAGASGAEASAQVELALEAISPFPLSQLFYGWYWVPGVENAFVFAAYRRRFTSEQAATWSGTELVLPSFATLFGGTVEPATTVILSAAEGLTAMHWANAKVPGKVLFRPLAPEATEEDRARLRDDLLRAIGGTLTVIDLTSPPVADPAQRDGEVVFHSGDFVSSLTTATASALDVRDKAELAGLRRSRARDVLFWRVAMGGVAALLLLGVGELALIGGRSWLKVQGTKVNAQKAPVEKIMTAQLLATRIDELATKRLLPFEMLSVLANAMPAEILFVRATASTAQNGLYTMVIAAQTTNVNQISVYEAALNKLKTTGMLERLEVVNEGGRGATATFRITATFKPEAFKTPSSQ